MEDAQMMRGMQSVRDLNADRKHKLQAGRSAANEPVERLAGNVLHDDIAFIAAFANFINSANIRMLDRRSQPGFAQHRRAQLLGRKQTGAQNLEDYRALQKRVVGQVDDAAAAGAQLALNLIVLDGSSLHLVQV